MQILLGEHYGSTGIKMNAQMGSNKTIMPGQLFIFGVATFVIDWAGHLGQFKTFTPSRIIRLGNLEYSMDSREELIL
jgi:hypothetical protein